VWKINVLPPPFHYPTLHDQHRRKLEEEIRIEKDEVRAPFFSSFPRQSEDRGLDRLHVGGLICGTLLPFLFFPTCRAADARPR